ncbi:hypothetical protein BASA50_001991 [Batrachochytrium salamandrivorans]|uniref:Calcineurin-like phosphoesterase domain-containing protein n=1 Tax=Batrachochytrium salamandrivorans TaxID=1357716 RepID=A0ABQ8FMK0_9FUNG|nr:hypothetical protein BASA50_001991 [Batrachochytrium salamandrivorans]
MRFTVAALIALLATVSSVTAQPAFGLNPGAQLEKGNPPSNTLYKNNRSTESVLRLKVSPAVPRPAQRVFSKEANAAKLEAWRAANVKHRQYTKRLLGMIPDITTTSDNEDQLRNMALSKKIACALKRRHVRLNAYSKKLKNSTKRLVHKNSLAHQLDMMINRTRRYTVQAILHARKRPFQDTTDSRLEEETNSEVDRLEEEAKLKENAKLEEARLKKVRLEAAKIEKAKIDEAKIERAKAEVAKQRQSDLSKSQLEQLFGIYSTRSWKSISKRRVVAVGDLHGDFEMSVKTLLMAKIINDDLEWIAGNTILVQTGDVVDRGHDTIELYALLRDLTDQAKKHGGRLIQLLGNHEVMNMAEDLRYVSKEDIASYGGLDVRLKAFSKHGDIGEYLRTLGVAAQVDGTVFFHAGANLQWSKLGVDVLNTLARQELVDQDAKYISKSEIFSSNGPLWYRDFAKRKDYAFCDVVKAVLSNLKATRMVIGHTPTEDGMIDDRCNGLVYIIDVGISKAIRGRIAALKIVGNRVTPLYP